MPTGTQQNPSVAKPTPWRPHPGPQTEFLQLGTVAYEALFGGSKGPGKTDCLIMEALRQVSHPRYHGLLMRRTYPQLREIMDRAHRWYPSCGGRWEGTDNRWRFPTGALISMGHCQNENDKFNYQGHEYHYIGFDQLEQFSETIYLYMLSQQRRSVPDLMVYVRSTANPGGIGHAWVKQRFVDMGPNHLHRDPASGSTRIFIPATIRDNPSLLDNDPEYINRLRLLPDSDQKAFIEGDWNIFAGQFFNEWSQSIHVCNPIGIPHAWRKIISIDYGFEKPSAVGWWAIDPSNHWWLYRELYAPRMTYPELAREVMERTPIDEAIDYAVADPACWGMRPTDKELPGETGGEIMERKFQERRIGLYRANHDRIQGWQRCRQIMKIELGTDRRPYSRLHVFSTCRHFIRTIPSLIHDEHRVEDLDTDGEDHHGDQFRYAVNSRVEQEKRFDEESSYDSILSTIPSNSGYGFR